MATIDVSSGTQGEKAGGEVVGKLFEQLTEQDVSALANWIALGTIIFGPVLGLIVGKIRKLVVHDFLYGLLWGLLGPLMALVWAIVDVRTSFYDYTYRAANPGSERLLWKVYDATGVLKPYPVDDVYGLVSLAVGVIVLGAVLGVVLSFVTRWIDSRFAR